MVDGVNVLSTVSGLSREEISGIWDKVRANHAKLKSCSRHQFNAPIAKLGQRLTCLNCGGEMGLMDVGNYIRGYMASGNPSGDIWPAYAELDATSPPDQGDRG